MIGLIISWFILSKEFWDWEVGWINFVWDWGVGWKNFIDWEVGRRNVGVFCIMGWLLVGVIWRLLGCVGLEDERGMNLEGFWFWVRFIRFLRLVDGLFFVRLIIGVFLFEELEIFFCVFFFSFI